MRQPLCSAELASLRPVAALSGAILLAGGALAFDQARAHMITLGAICGGDPHSHCGWCYMAAALIASGLAAFVLAALSGRQSLAVSRLKR